MMKRAVAVLLVWAASATAADAPDLLGLMPADAQAIFGVHVKAIAESALTKAVTTEFDNGAPADWRKLTASIPINPLRDIDEIVIAAKGEGRQSGALYAAHGRINVQDLPAHAEPYHDIPVIAGAAGQGSTVGAFALLNDHTFLGGDLAEVHAAIDRWVDCRDHCASPALAGELAGYAATYDVWGAVDKPSGLANQVAPDSKSETLDSIDCIRFGANLRDGLDVAAEVHLHSEKDTADLTGSLRLVQAMLHGGKLNVENHEKTLKIAFFISAEDLKRRMQTETHVAEQKPQAPQRQAVPETPRPGLRIQSSETGSAVVGGQSDGGTAVFRLPGGK